MKPKKYFAESLEEIKRSSRDHVFSITFDTKPIGEGDSDCIGAFALCWIDADTLLEAEMIAVERLIASGWQPTRFEEHNLVSCDSDKYNQDGYTEEEINQVLAQVAMAQKNGFYVRFHKYQDHEH